LLKPKVLKASLWRGAQSALNLCAAKRRILLFSNRRFESAFKDLNNQVAVKIFDFKSATYPFQILAGFEQAKVVKTESVKIFDFKSILLAPSSYPLLPSFLLGKGYSMRSQKAHTAL